MVRALELLFALGALDSDAKLTKPIGIQMAELPVAPEVGRMLLAGSEMGCAEEASTVAACMGVQSVWARGSGRKEMDEARFRFAAAEGDHVAYLNVYEAFVRSGKSGSWCHTNCVNYKAMIRVSSVRAQLANLLRRLGRPLASCGRDVEKLRKAIVAGFFPNAAQLEPLGDGSTYKRIRGGGDLSLRIHPASVLFRTSPKLVVYQTLQFVGSNVYMAEVAPVKKEWLLEMAPHFYQKGGKGGTQAA
eukprot:TRINITY_DN5547_c0_g3_i1.p1 TRINITY_DN5547_c0_g3~~TRINITY_DN5547_c0_g3_i1.p1  ORF type:complete len:262 (+),score=48.67 TRINITY_DN5547_c0_g3_i1:50-787(+)